MSYFTCVIQMCFFFLLFHQAKAKEEKLKKCGEDDETVPPEYRLKPAMVRCQLRCMTAAQSAAFTLRFVLSVP